MRATGRLRRALFPFLPLIGLAQQLLVPPLLAVAVLQGAGRNALVFAALALALAAYVAVIVPAGRWQPRWLLAVPLLSLLAVPAGLALPPPRLWPDGGAVWGGALWDWALALAMAAVTLRLGAVALRLRRGRRPPPGWPLRLALPLGPGRYAVTQGGATAELNHHLATLRDPARRGQAHGVDIVGLHRTGTAAWPPFARRAERHAIFGAEVRAPARGVVVAVRDGLPDHGRFRTDPAEPMGNHVWLRVADGDRTVLVLLAHLRCGSLSVRPGDRVAPGTPLGAVGNSGNSTEPHLHIHAQLEGDGTAPMAAAPVPMRFDGLGRLLRNRRFAVAQPRSTRNAVEAPQPASTASPTASSP